MRPGTDSEIFAARQPIGNWAALDARRPGERVRERADQDHDGDGHECETHEKEHGRVALRADAGSKPFALTSDSSREGLAEDHEEESDDDHQQSAYQGRYF
jgi:hypothetical protein